MSKGISETHRYLVAPHVSLFTLQHTWQTGSWFSSPHILPFLSHLSTATQTDCWFFTNISHTYLTKCRVVNIKVISYGKRLLDRNRFFKPFATAIRCLDRHKYVPMHYIQPSFVYIYICYIVSLSLSAPILVPLKFLYILSKYGKRWLEPFSSYLIWTRACTWLTLQLLLSCTIYTSQQSRLLIDV